MKEFREISTEFYDLIICPKIEIYLSIISLNLLATLQACDRTFQYGESVYTATHSYLNEAIPSYYLRQVNNIEITWHYDDLELYTVMLVDAGYKTLSALWVNAARGQVKEAEVWLFHRPMKK